MAKFTQANWPIAVTTPLGPDALLLEAFTGREAMSGLFHFQLDLLAETTTEVPFEKLLGQKITIALSLPDGKKSNFSGIVSRISQGSMFRVADAKDTFIRYRAEMVPQFWLLTHNVQSRIFQQISVPDILKKVLAGLDVTYEIQGTFHPRDYCVQYRESDFAFANRLMEEEGIFYFFKHSDGAHKMVVANTAPSHPDVPGATKAIYEEVVGGARPEERVLGWEKSQEIRPGKYTLWDHCFELPHKHLEAEQTILDKIQAGKVSHPLKVGGNDKLEVYDYPGGYADRFDGVPPGGGEKPADLQKIFEDNKRTVAIRMQQQALPSLVINGHGSCRQFVSGHKFSLERHFNADGQYLLTEVEHQGHQEGNYLAGAGTYVYSNQFRCIPLALPFRPPQVTPKPVVEGSQTAVVVGPAGEEIFTDKYGRVKVQFHWDRQGKNNADSSCWVRVGTPWAGKQWGMIHIPRIGHEVIVDFLEGDPDRPIAIVSVYNSDTMPPYKLPDNKTQSGIKSRSSLKGTPENFNEIRFEDKKGSEQLFIHAEKNQDIEVENNETHWVGHDRTKTIDHDETTHIKHDRTETVDNDETITIKGNRTEEVDKDETITIKGNRTEEVDKDETITIKGNRTKAVDKDETINIGQNRQEEVKKNESVSIGENRSHSVTKNDDLNVGKALSITAGDQIAITTGDASIVMKKDGSIMIKGKDIMIDGSGKITVKAASDMTLKASKIAQN